MGDSAVCEHFGNLRNPELSRFRNSQRKVRICPLCGHYNSINVGVRCEKVLVCVEYEQQHEIGSPPAWVIHDGNGSSSSDDLSSATAAVATGSNDLGVVGHHSRGACGHFTGEQRSFRVW
jgi:hypothetical protein